jgi:hypothetical protein
MPTLEDANKQLMKQVAEAETAKKKAEAEQLRAQKASDEAKQAKREVEQLLARERAKLQAAEKELQSAGIATGDLLGKKGGK